MLLPSDNDRLPEGYTANVVRGFFYGAFSAHPRFMTHWMLAGGFLFFHGRDALKAMDRAWSYICRTQSWDLTNIAAWYEAAEVLRLLGLEREEESLDDRPAPVSGEFIA
jgi:hypothetical protein